MACNSRETYQLHTSCECIAAPASRTISTAQVHVPVGKNVSTVPTVNSAMMRTTPVAREKMTCKSYLMINRIAVVTNFLKSFFESSINAD